MPDDSAYAWERDEYLDAEEPYEHTSDLLVGSVSMDTIARVERREWLHNKLEKETP